VTGPGNIPSDLGFGGPAPGLEPGTFRLQVGSAASCAMPAGCRPLGPAVTEYVDQSVHAEPLDSAFSSTGPRTRSPVDGRPGLSPDGSTIGDRALQRR
jgi:hypothetical protein